MKCIYLFILFAPLLLQAQSAKITSDKDAEWSSFKSFEVTPGELVTVTKEEVDKATILEAVTGTINDILEDKGYSSKAGDSDLLVTFTAEIAEVTNVEDVGPLGQTPADEAIEVDQSRTWSRESSQGSLAIDITSKSNGKSVWRSTVTLEFGADDLVVVLRAATAKALRKLPEQKK